VRILIPDAVPFPLPDLPLEVIHFEARGAVPASLDAEAVLVWGLPARTLEPLLQLPSLRWVQALTAGIDHVLKLQPRPQITVCNGKGLHDAPTAELAVALLLAAVRRLHVFRDLQHTATWGKDAYQQALEGGSEMTLEGSRVLVVGMGAIGVEIARRLQPFGALVEGVAMAAGVRGGFTTHALSDLDALLPLFDAVVLVLPNTPQTVGLLSKERLALLKRKAWVVNVGRGNAIDEAALLEALEARAIGGAALDVTEREPLPQDSGLWHAPNCIITPHVAGGGPNWARKAAALLERNAKRFAHGEPLENVVDSAKGY
jgi:phosphoglycerate dehydrogenase-like enzyme